MDNTIITDQPKRITDLINCKEKGFDLSIDLSFEIVPVNFAHENHEFQAYTFLCKYSGSVNNKEFFFRKCYAKGCPHNLCPHVAQAVMIANRYLKKDYKKLLDAGILVNETFFTLEDMVLKFKELGREKDETSGGILTIHDYINIAKEGNPVEVQIHLEMIPAVEHFANQKNEQTYLMADFDIMTLGKKNKLQRCFACFQTGKESLEKASAIQTANDRLKILFNEFQEAEVQFTANFFN
ncbi:MAG: hypothetical protein B6230_04765 [Desulfobacteraceae bacterium 4572_89]|nr:MAG: hypothetical protein B6230_04765 [Desulfobacteraceae bacterium 4572_89]